LQLQTGQAPLSLAPPLQLADPAWHLLPAYKICVI
jgi:hypothetical protein